MPDNAPGVPGALFDPHALNALGGLNCGIGHGTNAVYGPPLTPGLDSGDQVGVARIGAAPPYAAAQACGFAGDMVTLSVATGNVAPGGAMPDGGTNRTGRTVPTGAGAYSVKTPGEPEAADWAARVLSNGGTYSAAMLQAVSDFVAAAKASGYWAKLVRVNLFCGVQLAACLVPLKVGPGHPVDVDGNSLFVPADYTPTTGLRGHFSAGGGGGYLDTGIVPSTHLQNNNVHVAVYDRSGFAQGGAAIGCHSASFQLVLNLQVAFGGTGQCYARAGDSSVFVDAPNRAAPFGFLVASRQSATVFVLYQRGAGAASNATPNPAAALPETPLYVMGQCLGTPGIGDRCVGHQLGGYSIGTGLTPAEVADYSTHMQAFQTALGRAV